MDPSSGTRNTAGGWEGALQTPKKRVHGSPMTVCSQPYFLPSTSQLSEFPEPLGIWPEEPSRRVRAKLCPWALKLTYGLRGRESQEGP